MGATGACKSGYKLVEVILEGVKTLVCQPMTDAEKRKEKLKTGLIVGLVVGIPCLVILMVAICHCYNIYSIHRERQRFIQRLRETTVVTSVTEPRAADANV